MEGVYHVTIELLRRRPVLLLTSSGGDGDDVGGGSGVGVVVVDRRTRVEPTTKTRGGALAGYRFLYNSIPRPPAHCSVTLYLGGRRVYVVLLCFLLNRFWGL